MSFLGSTPKQKCIDAFVKFDIKLGLMCMFLMWKKIIFF
jgi:hypothetical protein